MASVTFTASSAGAGTGPYTIYHTSISVSNIVVTGVTRSEILSGYTLTTTPFYNTYVIYSNDSFGCGSSVTLNGCIPPDGVSPSSLSQSENTATGTTISTLTSSNPYSGDTYTFSLVSGVGDTDNASFTLTSGGVLSNNVVFDYETKTSYSIRVRITNQNGLYTDAIKTISVIDVNEAPYSISLSSTTVDENSVTGTTVGTLSTGDVDSGDTHTYTLVTGVGDTNNGSFYIDGNLLKTNEIFDYEAKSVYSIRVRTTDSGGLYMESSFEITINNVNDAPSNLLFSSTTIYENQPTGTTVSTLIGVDQDAGETFTYSLVSGTGDADNSSFYIFGNSLKSNEIFDYETKSSYSVRVQVTDSVGATYSINKTINILDVVISGAASSTNTTCWSGDTGTITVTSYSGGTGPYTFSVDGTNYQSGTGFTSLPDATYTVYVKDSYGEIGTVSNVVVGSPSMPSAFFTVTNPDCNGGNGSITVTSPTGGSGSGYQVKLGTGGTYTSTFPAVYSVGHGTYDVYVKDGAGCVSTGYTSAVFEPSAVSVSVSGATAPTCFGDTDGSITVTSSGGTGTKTYSINGGSTYQASGTFSGLGSGTYTIYAKDDNDCTGSTSQTITRTQISANVSTTGATCFGGTGTITVLQPVGGSGTGYQVKLDGGVYTSTFPVTYSSVSVGTHTITIKDSLLCTRTYSPEITQTDLVQFSYGQTNPTCYNSSDGSVTISGVTGGNGSYEYSFNQGASWSTNNVATGLTTGTTYLSVRDTAGCLANGTSTDLITTMPTAVFTVSNVNCNGGSDGEITVESPSGGSGSGYQVKLGTGGIYTSIFPITYTVSAGSYDVYIKDGAGCESTGYAQAIFEPTAQSISITSVTGGTNGALTVSTTGGTWNKIYRLYQDTTSPYTVGGGTLVDTVSGVTSASPSVTFTGLSEGYYYVISTDANGCTVTSTIESTITSANYYEFDYCGGHISDSPTAGSVVKCSVTNLTTAGMLTSAPQIGDTILLNGSGNLGAVWTFNGSTAISDDGFIANDYNGNLCPQAP